MQISSIGKAPLNEGYFVDTNIWVYQAYYANKVVEPTSQVFQKLNDYSDFLQKIKHDGGILYTSPLCLSELGYFIEKQAHQHYKNTHTQISQKEFRAITAQRTIILKDIQQAWEDIKSLAEILPFHTDNQMGDNLIQTMQQYPLDAYDAVFLLTMQKHNIRNIISDDKDFHPISTIDIYTTIP